LRVEDAKTLTIDGYRAMLNTGLLEREWVPFFVHCTCSIVEQSIQGVGFESIIEEVGDYVADIQATVSKATP
jgi:hypothetical protein